MSDLAKKRLVVAAEVTLVVVILGLLVVNWMPVLVGAHPWRGQ